MKITDYVKIFTPAVLFLAAYVGLAYFAYHGISHQFGAPTNFSALVLYVIFSVMVSSFLFSAGLVVIKLLLYAYLALGQHHVLRLRIWLNNRFGPNKDDYSYVPPISYDRLNKDDFATVVAGLRFATKYYGGITKAIKPAWPPTSLLYVHLDDSRTFYGRIDETRKRISA